MYIKKEYIYLQFKRIEHVLVYTLIVHLFGMRFKIFSQHMHKWCNGVA